MAQITYNDVMSQPDGYVGFFSLPHDGDAAVVRFLHDSVNDFTILTRHEVGQGKFYRTVDCLRTPHDPVNVCPFCEGNVKLAQRFYVRILRYDTDENGQVQVTPCIWERSTAFATTMKGYIDNYGPMSNIVCKIVRKGTGLNTKYEIIPNLNPEIYRPDVYVCRPELFENYTVVGNAVMAKTADEMRYYLQTGQFPSSDVVNETPIEAVSPVAPVQPASWGQSVTPVNTMPPQTYVGDFPPAQSIPTTPMQVAPLPANVITQQPAQAVFPGAINAQSYDGNRPVRHYSS